MPGTILSTVHILTHLTEVILSLLFPTIKRHEFVKNKTKPQTPNFISCAKANDTKPRLNISPN